MRSNCRIPHPAWIEVDLKQFRKNIAILRGYIGSALFCLPVKANAYGHGLCAISRAAAEAGVDYLAVAHLQEGIELREAGIAIPILVLGAIHEDQIADLIDYQLEFTISSQYKAELVAKKCSELSNRCRVHIEVDTGMRRTGVRATSAKSLFQYVDSTPCFDIVGIYSHLATAQNSQDPVARSQMAEFFGLLEDPVFQKKPLIRHLASSGGVVFFPELQLDMVRPSIVTFGYLPQQASSLLQGIAPCFSVKAKVSYSKIVEAGQGISYGHSHITSSRTRVVTVPIGYGDGYRRILSNRGIVLIQGKRFPIIGTICMDQFMVDVGQEDIHVGDEVVLIGRQGDEQVSLDEISSLCETIPYEVLCLFNQRMPRIYL